MSGGGGWGVPKFETTFSQVEHGPICSIFSQISVIISLRNINLITKRSCFMMPLKKRFKLRDLSSVGDPCHFVITDPDPWIHTSD